MNDLAHLVRTSPPTQEVGGLAGGGMTVPLFRRRRFDLDLLAAGETESTVVARAVRVEHGGEGLLLLRVHDNDMGASRVATLRVVSEAPCDDDPDTDFVARSDAAAAQVDDVTAAGTLRVAALTPGYSHAVRAIVDLRNDSGSSTGGGTIELSADLYVRPGVASPKRRFVSFSYDSAVNTLVYVPFCTAGETAFPPGAAHTLVMEATGRVEMVAIMPATGDAFFFSTVAVHLNGSATASASELRAMPGGVVTNFFPAPIAKFYAGDRLHVSVDPVAAPGEVVGTVVLRMDEGAGS